MKQANNKMITYDKSIKSYFKNLTENDKRFKTLIYDGEKHNYFITNKYSFIRLNYNNKKDINKVNFIKENYGICENNSIIKQIQQYNDTFNNYNHCNYIDINNLKVEKDTFNDKIVRINGRVFNLKEINKIKRVLGGKIALYYSKNNDTTLSIVSSNGYAFLLGCITY